MVRFRMPTLNQMFTVMTLLLVAKELGRVNAGIKLGIQQQPTIFNGRLYLRGNDTVVCYQAGILKD